MRRFRLLLLGAFALLFVGLAGVTSFGDVGPVTLPAYAQAGDDSRWNVASPDGDLVVVVSQGSPEDPSSAGNDLYYRVELEGKTIIENSPLGVTMSGEDGDFVNSLTFVGETGKTLDNSYQPVGGKKKVYRDYANEKVLTFKNSSGGVMEVAFRAYNDGVAYNYRFPGKGERQIVSEASGFNMPDGANGWMQPYRVNYENYYSQGVVGSDFQTGEFGFPSLFNTAGGSWVLLTEAAVNGDYGAVRLTGSGGNDGLFQVKFPEESFSSSLPWETPWRVAIVGKKLGTVVESDLVSNLNPPSKVEDTDWIEPGRVAWSWWSDSSSPSNLDRQKEFVDFAQEMGWEYVLVDEGWNPNWVPELDEYANARGVGVLLWAHWTDLDTEEERESKLPLWKSWGIEGFKVDFMDSDTQARMQFYDAITKAALENKLMVNFHGATLPKGATRTWPHQMTYEAVFGAEQKFPSPAHNATLPFTRNVVGPMDYTPVTFSMAGRRETTAAHELALSVVFQSDWQHFADSPESYNRYPNAKDFLRKVPATWDDTRFVGGYPGESATMARRSGEDWFVGTINAGRGREASIPLRFLGRGAYTAWIYEDDGRDGLKVRQKIVTARDRVTAAVPANGGLAMRFSPRGASSGEPPATNLYIDYEGSYFTPGKTKEVTTTLTNNGLAAITDVELNLEAPSSWAVEPTSRTTFGSVPPRDRSVQSTWNVTPPADAGGGQLRAKATYTYGGGKPAEVQAQAPAKIFRPATQDGSYLSDMEWIEASNGWGPVERDTSNGETAAGDGNPITLDDVIYEKGLGTHAPSKVTYALGGDCSTFTADVGVDEEVGDQGKVVFQLWGDGAKLYDSGALTGSMPSQQVNANIEGVEELSLVVTTAGGTDSDHADWADARVACSIANPDTVAPQVEAQLDPAQPNGNGLWYTQPVKVTLNANDEDSGIASIEYRVDDGQWQAYESPITIDAQGKHTLNYRATDEAGNTSEVKSASMWIDTQKPTATATLDPPEPNGAPTEGYEGTYNTPVEVTLNADDGEVGSGVQAITYRLDKNRWQRYTEPVEVSGEGEHTIRYRARDRAGNAGEIKTVSFEIKNDACVGSDLREKVWVGERQTKVDNVDTGDGCTVNDLINALIEEKEQDWKNHGQFMRQFNNEITDDLVDEDVISKQERGKIHKAAAQSDVGKKDKKDKNKG